VTGVDSAEMPSGGIRINLTFPANRTDISATPAVSIRCVAAGGTPGHTEARALHRRAVIHPIANHGDGCQSPPPSVLPTHGLESVMDGR